MKRVQLLRTAAVVLLALALAAGGASAKNRQTAPKSPSSKSGGGSSHKPPKTQPPPPIGDFPYPTASTVSELVDDITYANTVGGAFTITLAPGATFIFDGADFSIGDTKAVDLTIIGNGDTIQHEGVFFLKLFTVYPESALTLDQVTVQGFESINWGGAIANWGTLTLRNGTALIGNQGQFGGAIANSGTLTITDSLLSDNIAALFYGSGGAGGAIYNYGGTVTISNSLVVDNGAVSAGAMAIDGGTVTISGTTLSGNWAGSDYYGVVGGCPGLFNAGGTVTVENFSYLKDWENDNRGELYLDSTSEIDVLYGNPAIPF